MLRLERVSKSYGRRLVLHSLDLTFPLGSFTLVVGANGAGKTTLLRLLTTTVKPTAGKLRWGKTGDPDLAREEIRGRIGYAGHTPLLYDELTARENLEFALAIRGWSPQGRREATARWIHQWGLSARAEDRVQTFSRGQRQRLALAQAFCVEPKFLILDEPGANLDADGFTRLRALLKEAKGRTGVVLATHDPRGYGRLADRVLELRGGTTHERGGRT